MAYVNMKDFAQNCQACGIEHTSGELATIKISGFPKLKVCENCRALSKVATSYTDAAILIASLFETDV